jgi:hypothetical protein
VAVVNEVEPVTTGRRHLVTMLADAAFVSCELCPEELHLPDDEAMVVSLREAGRGDATDTAASLDE